MALAVVLALMTGCESEGSEVERDGESADAPAAQIVRDFYDAANRSAGTEACALLTTQGRMQIVHVASQGACVTAINTLAPGSFSNVLHVEGVDERGGEGFSVDAQLKSRSGGTYTVIKRDGRLLIDGFESDEG